MVELLTENALGSALVATAIVAAVSALWRRARDRRDADAIHRFLAESAEDTDFTFRSTEAIAAHTQLTEARVEALCAGDPRIRRSTGTKRSWRLVD